MESYNIDITLLSKILTLITDKGYLRCDDYDISITFEKTPKFGCKIKRPNYSKRVIIIKYQEKNKNKEFYTMLAEYLFDQYDFELKAWADELDTTYLTACVVFSILHEFGHVIDYITRLNNGGDLVDRAEMGELSKYWEVSKIPELKQRFAAYRRISNEANADEMAMMIMERHKLELKALI